MSFSAACGIGPRSDGKTRLLPGLGTRKVPSEMSVADIVREVPHLSLEEMKEVALALREAMEDNEDLADVQAVLDNPGTPIPMSEIRGKYHL